jgi:cyanophycinase-like exopeptidase
MTDEELKRIERDHTRAPEPRTIVAIEPSAPNLKAYMRHLQATVADLEVQRDALFAEIQRLEQTKRDTIQAHLDEAARVWAIAGGERSREIEYFKRARTAAERRQRGEKA